MDDAGFWKRLNRRSNSLQRKGLGLRPPPLKILSRLKKNLSILYMGLDRYQRSGIMRRMISAVIIVIFTAGCAVNKPQIVEVTLTHNDYSVKIGVMP